jgi:pre-mRNA 3'-end-processing factor FIP1
MAQQQMYPQMEAPQPSAPAGLGRGAGAVPYRARGLRGARGFPSRGRGRGGYDGALTTTLRITRPHSFSARFAAPPPPVRPTSPLPPNVPTGPRNQNKYKDRDGNAPAVDGLDYGGTKDGRTNSGEPEERSRYVVSAAPQLINTDGERESSKRRISPGLDDVRGSKRR